MKMLRIFATLCFVVSAFLFGFSQVEAATAPDEGIFKNYYSDGWFGTYALREFDKIAPVPGVNWFVDDAQDWLNRAQREGWVVRRKPSEAINGSIIVGYNEGLAWVGIAREVTEKGMLFETFTVAEGKPARRWMNFDEVLNLIHFQGCILPQRLPGMTTVSPMMDYKGIQGFNGSAWAVREFDLVAPKPGFNWQGAEKDWADEANRKGWTVESKPDIIKPGSLMILQHFDTAQIKVAVVRESLGNIVVFEFVDPSFGRVITVRLTVEQLMDKTSFGGYVFKALILPEKKRK